MYYDKNAEKNMKGVLLICPNQSTFKYDSGQRLF